jgi:hypothetical protein
VGSDFESDEDEDDEDHEFIVEDDAANDDVDLIRLDMDGDADDRHALLAIGKNIAKLEETLSQNGGSGGKNKAKAKAEAAHISFSADNRKALNDSRWSMDETKTEREDQKKRRSLSTLTGGTNRRK